MAVFGAIVMYIISMLSLFALRKNEPEMSRPFPAMVYPLFPAIALILAAISLVTMIYYNQLLAELFVALMAIAYGYFLLTKHHREAAVDKSQMPVVG
jgi:ethanolamine permease